MKDKQYSEHLIATVQEMRNEGIRLTTIACDLKISLQDVRNICYGSKYNTLTSNKMKVEEKQLLIIGQAVVDGITVGGTYGAAIFTAQQLLDRGTVKLETVEAFYGRIQGELAAIPKKSLRDREEKSPLTINLERQAELLETVYDIRKAAEKAAKESKKARDEAQARLVTLRGIRDKQEIEKLEKMSEADLEKEIAATEALLEA